MKYIAPSQLALTLKTKKHFVWLDSLKPHASHSPQEEGLSLLAAEPDLILEGGPSDWPLLEQELALRHQAYQTACSQAAQKENLFQLPKKRERQGSLNVTQPSHKTTVPLASGPASQEQFPGAAIGFFRYDGSFCFGFYNTVYRHQASSQKTTWLTPLPSSEELVDVTLPSSQKPSSTQLHFQPDLTATKYCSMVLKAQEEIAAGNIYQICLSHRLQASCAVDPWHLYLSLRQRSPAPFAAYLNLGKETILSSSPECFLKIEKNHILTRPIKGTRPRGKTKEEDDLLSTDLQASLKENAELVMITDLERNDLGRICEFGSVHTSQLLHLESYPQVFHLVSTVEGALRSDISHVGAVAACFPGGSISGAPKKKAMEIIQALEPVPRGLFTGAIGYFGFDGRSQFNIAIRTMVIHAERATLHVGAGITSDSIPEEEWKETLHKAAGILQATCA